MNCSRHRASPLARRHGRGVARGSMKLAIIFIVFMSLFACNEATRLRSKAENGDVLAMRQLARKYESMYDKDVRQNGDLAIYWYTIAANNGDTESMYALCGLYEINQSKQSQEKALNWVRRGADKGDPNCMGKLAEAYRYGNLGLVKDENQYRYWMDKAMAIDREREKAWPRR